ncbi:MAG: glycosyltransferase family 2 protein [Tannerella sp.]|jgi:GT2 family glycosyltransferase|nr:glycosyltransferase family 2 protein [Tannerella sp.]
MKVSVVILNWNGEALLRKFLPSVIANTPSHVAEIMVADNGSKDNSVSMLQNEFPSVRLILFDRNYGFAEGYNQAISHIDSTYVVLLNSDVEITPNWLDAPLRAMEADDKLAGVQPKILAYHDKKTFEYAGAAGGWIDAYGYPFCRGRVLHNVEEDRGQYDDPANIFWASGACFFVRTEVFKKEGGFDAQFFAHQEEIDFCWRLRARGYRLACIPLSIVYHVGGATLQTESPQKTFLNFRNNLIMIYKNMAADRLQPVMRRRFWLDYVALIKFFLTGHPANAKAVIQARKAFKLLQKEYVPVREDNLSKTIVSPIPEMFRKSLIVAFYLKRKKTFTSVVSGS